MVTGKQGGCGATLPGTGRATVPGVSWPATSPSWCTPLRGVPARPEPRVPMVLTTLPARGTRTSTCGGFFNKKKGSRGSSCSLASIFTFCLSREKPGQSSSEVGHRGQVWGSQGARPQAFLSWACFVKVPNLCVVVGVCTYGSPPEWWTGQPVCGDSWPPSAGVGEGGRELLCCLP